jgi:hypothetical protein
VTPDPIGSVPSSDRAAITVARRYAELMLLGRRWRMPISICALEAVGTSVLLGVNGQVVDSETVSWLV